MSEKKLARVFYADLWGLRDEKYKYLFKSEVNTTNWQELEPAAPYYFFVPKDFALQSEYEKFWKVTDIFREWSSGVETGKDDKLVGFTPQEKVKVFLDIFSPKVNMKDLEAFYDLKPTSGWKTEDRRKELFRRGETFFQENIIPYAYRPFDTRFTYYCDFLRRAHREIMDHLLRDNLALLTSRLLARPPFCHIFVTQNVSDRCYISIKTKETGYLFPIYLYSDRSERLFFGEAGHKSERIPNLTPEFLQALKETLGSGPSPEEIFYYIYAVLYSPAHRKRYEEFLKIDFPRIPLTSNKKLFEELSVLGKELVELHLLKASALDEINHYMKVAKAIRLTIELQEKIDEVCKSQLF